MTREEAIYILKNTAWLGTDEMVKAIDLAIEALSEAEQVTGKLKNPCDSLLTDDSGERKERKSKLESAEVAPRIDHDREWIIGCIKHDGFIHTHRFDKANQIIHDALSAEAVEVVRCKDCIRTKERDEYTRRLWCSIHRGYMEDTYYCADGLHREDGEA